MSVFPSIIPLKFEGKEEGMSQHTSLKVSSVGAKHRNVLKRHERIKKMKEMEKWDDRKTALGLPKIKSQKIKVRKTKAEKTEEKAATPAAGAAAPAAPAGAAKPKAAS